jgi:polysaccharide export outer membrane protein
MTINLKRNSILQLLCLSTLLFVSSCVSRKNVTYLENVSSAKRSTLENVTTFVEPIIQPDDILAVSINTIDPTSAAVVNQAGATISVSSSSGAGNSSAREEVSGYLVDKNGEIELSLIGRVKVAGLTTFQAKELIRAQASRDLKSPNVSVRFANFKVSVLGEVNRPTAYSLPNEKVSILDVLSLAGDLTIFGRRDNIMVIRDVNGKKEFGRLNLNSTDLFNNPYYFLKQNDVVYVEPNNAKVTQLNNNTRTTIALAISVISTAVLIYTRL